MYATPAHIARVLTKHVPKQMTRLLEPAVGDGALILPILRRLERQDTTLVCVDTDASAIAGVKTKLSRFKFVSKCINQDFLLWGTTEQPHSFDCILMNPPFAGTRAHSRRINSEFLIDVPIQAKKKLPIEAAFVCVALRLLATNGRLLSVLPSSVVNSESLHWLRSLLLSKGSIECVYEFPSRTFANVDSKIYLLVFKKGRTSGRIKLIGSGAEVVQSFSRSNQSNFPIRFDFDYHSSLKRMNTLKQYKLLKWTPIGEVASVIRGTVSSAPRIAGVVHSTDYTDHEWKLPLGSLTNSSNRGTIQCGDLLVRRVGRNNHNTLGDACLVVGRLATDCLFIIRPHFCIQSVELHFALEMLFGLGWSANLLERGTGARYYCKSSLEQLYIPLSACNVFVECFELFVLGRIERDSEKMNTAVSKATLSLETSNFPKISKLQPDAKSLNVLPRDKRNQSVPTFTGVPPKDVCYKTI